MLDDEVGEMVIIKLMFSMLVYFWNDVGKVCYWESYFELFLGIWWYGDWVKIISWDFLVILGCLDVMFNWYGVCIGIVEIYWVVNKVKVIKDSLIVNLELEGGWYYMFLFVLMNEGEVLIGIVKVELKIIFC